MLDGWGFWSLVLVLISLAGSPALAADADHGNPGQFVDNIRKGLSGISKYFWSPKVLNPETQAPLATADEKADERKLVAKKMTLRHRSLL